MDLDLDNWSFGPGRRLGHVHDLVVDFVYFLELYRFGILNMPHVRRQV